MKFDLPKKKKQIDVVRGDDYWKQVYRQHRIMLIRVHRPKQSYQRLIHTNFGCPIQGKPFRMNFNLSIIRAI